MYKESFEKGRIAATNIVFAIWLADGININICNLTSTSVHLLSICYRQNDFKTSHIENTCSLNDSTITTVCKVIGGLPDDGLKGEQSLLSFIKIITNGQ